MNKFFSQKVPGPLAIIIIIVVVIVVAGGVYVYDSLPKARSANASQINSPLINRVKGLHNGKAGQ